LVDFISSFKRLALIVAILIATACLVVLAYDALFAPETHLSITPEMVHQTVRTVIVVVFGSIIVVLIRQTKSLLTKQVGTYLATVLQFFMMLAVGIVVLFVGLSIFQVSPTTLLVGGGIATIVVGLVISTLVGNILAGTLVLMTRPFSVGDTVAINNIPGKVEEITAMVTKIRNDMGGKMVIPNTAIMQGGVIVTTYPQQETMQRLPYSEGDKVYTTYLSEAGTVKQVTPFHTKILLDSGKELTFMNSSVLTGTVAVARIREAA